MRPTLDINLYLEIPRATPWLKKAFALVSPVDEYLIFWFQVAKHAFKGLPINGAPKASICG